MNIRFFPAADALTGYRVQCDMDGSSELIETLAGADALAQQCYDNEIALVGCTSPRICMASGLIADVLPIAKDSGPARYQVLKATGTAVMTAVLDIDVEALPITITTAELAAKVEAAATETTKATPNDADRITRVLRALRWVAEWCTEQSCDIEISTTAVAWRLTDDEDDENDGWW